MKKIIIILFTFLFVTGCSNSSDNVVDKFTKKIKNLDSYYLEGDLELRNNDEVYNYEVNVSYENNKYYKVSLKNKSNDSTQIILKNDEGVFILTPSLNRSFKFQSDWPYNNSQIYLLKALVRDIIEDSEYKFEESKKYYSIKTKVNYPNNKDLNNQKIVLDKKCNLIKVVVYNKDSVPEMELKIDEIDYSPSFEKDYFEINTIMSTFDEKLEVQETMTLEDTIYPLVLPTGTKLSYEEKILKTNGERVLMTFEGDKPFLLVEETANREEEFTIIPTNGVPYQLMDTLGVMTDNSLNWSSNGIEYYLVSDVLSSEELIDIAESIYVLPTMK